MPRIVAGAAGGVRLAVPPNGTRPTSDRTREGLFSAVESRLGGLGGAAVLDLFAGSGAVGLEAWSRGAARVVFVESAPAALKTLRANIAALGAGGSGAEIAVVGRPVEQVVDSAATAAPGQGRASESPTVGPFDFVFADPPYALAAPVLADIVAALVRRRAVRAGGLIVIERAVRGSWSWPDGVEPLQERRYGDTVLHYGRPIDAP